MPIFVQRGEDRREVPSLLPFLRESLALGAVMDPSQMRAEDAANCAWVGWGIGKGVTSVERDVSVFGIPHELKSGLHAELVQGFPGVDPFPLCYDAQGHVHGFGGFVRWVYFADPIGPDNGCGVFGIDWSPKQPRAIGVAPTLHTIVSIAARACAHGVPIGSELVLLDWKMLEHPVLRQWRHARELVTLADWAFKAQGLLAPAGRICATCLNETIFAAEDHYCFMCGQEVHHGVEV